VERPQRGGGFQFDERRHEPGTKKVLGKKFKEHGEKEGRDLLHMLATQPATAQFISRKLAVRFVSDDPPKRWWTGWPRCFGRQTVILQRC